MKRVVTALAGVLMLAGCGAPDAPSVERAWVRLSAVPGRPGAAYLTLHGGAKGAALTALSTPAAKRVELHRSMGGGDHGMMSMAPIASLPVAAGQTVSLAPGGAHAMLFDLDPALKAGARTPLTLRLADGAALEVQAEVVGAGDPAPTD